MLTLRTDDPKDKAFLTAPRFSGAPATHRAPPPAQAVSSPRSLQVLQPRGGPTQLSLFAPTLPARPAKPAGR